MAWSTEKVYEATLQRARIEKLRVATIAACDDVDRPSDLGPLLLALNRGPATAVRLACCVTLLH